MMLGKKHDGCGGIWRVAKNISEKAESIANEHEDAAILTCSLCKRSVIDDTTHSRPDRYRKARVPDQGVFEVVVKNHTKYAVDAQVTIRGETDA